MYRTIISFVSTCYDMYNFKRTKRSDWRNVMPHISEYEVETKFIDRLESIGYKYAELKNYDVTWKVDYLNIPIVANFYVWKGLALKAGLQPGINVSSKLDGSAGNYHASVNIDDAVNTFDLALPLGISYDFGGLVLDARYTLGLTKTFKDNYLDSKNITFQIGIGYKFNL